MAGKKARCPECNAVSDSPLNDEIAVVSAEAAKQEVANEAKPPEPAPVQSTATAATTEPNTNQNPTSEVVIEPIPKGWLLPLGAPAGLIALAVVLFVFKLVDIAIICFALGIISFTAVSVMYCFGFGKK